MKKDDGTPIVFFIYLLTSTDSSPSVEAPSNLKESVFVLINPF